MSEKTKSAKFQQIVKTAGDLFMRHGIRRITVEEICQTAGVSKMTFYKYFSNKIEVAKYFINQRIAEAVEEYRAFMDQDIPFSEKVKKLIRLKLEKTKDYGWEFLGEMMHDPEPEIAECIDRIKEVNFQMFLQDLAKAQQDGDIKKDIKPEFILYMLNHLTDMTNDEQLVKLYNSPIELIAALTNFFFYGILPREFKDEQ